MKFLSSLQRVRALTAPLIAATVIVLAGCSGEYGYSRSVFQGKVVDRPALKARVVECVFEEKRNDNYKIISFMAKRARGLMARYAVTHKATTPKMLEGFTEEGYAFDAAVSTLDRMVFRRSAPV